MIRTAFFRTGLLLAGLGALAWVSAEPAHAGGWSFKKLRRSVEHRIQDVDKHADKIGDAGRKALRSKVVVKTKCAVQKTGAAIADGATQGAKAVGKAARSTSRKIRFGFRGTRKKVQETIPLASAGKQPCPPATPCPPADC